MFIIRLSEFVKVNPCQTSVVPVVYTNWFWHPFILLVDVPVLVYVSETNTGTSFNSKIVLVLKDADSEVIELLKVLVCIISNVKVAKSGSGGVTTTSISYDLVKMIPLLTKVFIFFVKLTTYVVGGLGSFIVIWVDFVYPELSLTITVYYQNINYQILGNF